MIKSWNSTYKCDILICCTLLSMFFFMIADIARKAKEDQDQLFSCTEKTKGKISKSEGMIDRGMLIGALLLKDVLNKVF